MTTMGKLLEQFEVYYNSTSPEKGLLIWIHYGNIV